MVNKDDGYRTALANWAHNLLNGNVVGRVVEDLNSVVEVKRREGASG